MNRLENNPVITLSPGACLRVAASARAGERAGVRGAPYHVHPSPSQRLSLRGRSPSGAEPEPAATSILPRQGGGAGGG